MPTRKSHSKSRKGCQTCKKRRVKCDEQGPPCANCRIRETPCSYDRGPASRDGPLIPPQARSRSSAASPPGMAGSVTYEASAVPELSGTSTATGASSSSLSISASTRTSVSPYTAPTGRGLLELELMHRWSTATYKSVCSLLSEKHLMQTLAPREALRHPFLLNSLFAFTALELAAASADRAEEAEDYALAAVELHDRADYAYKAVLGNCPGDNITRDNHLALFLFSVMELPMNLALRRFAPPDSAHRQRLRHARTCVYSMFDLLLSSTSVAKLCWDWLATGPVQVHAWIRQNVPVDKLDGAIREAMVRLHCLNDRLNRDNQNGAVANHDRGDDVDMEERGGNDGGGHSDANPPSLDHASCQTIILHLEDCFARDLDGSVKGCCLTWLGLAGRSFAAAFRRSEPLPLLLMMHWGVLLENLGREAWWATQTGRDLVIELSAEMRRLGLESLPVWQESIAWTREQIGLPGLV